MAIGHGSDGLASQELHPVLCATLAHGGHFVRWGFEGIAAVDEYHAGCCTRPGIAQAQGPVDCIFTIANDENLLASQVSRVVDAVKNLPVQKLFHAIELDAAGLEGSHTRRDEHGLGQQLRALGCGYQKSSIGLWLQFRDHLFPVEGGTEGGDLRQQVVSELLACTHRNAGYIKNRFVGVQLGGLPAGMG